MGVTANTRKRLLIQTTTSPTRMTVSGYQFVIKDVKRENLGNKKEAVKSHPLLLFHMAVPARPVVAYNAAILLKIIALALD